MVSALRGAHQCASTSLGQREWKLPHSHTSLSRIKNTRVFILLSFALWQLFCELKRGANTSFKLLALLRALLWQSPPRPSRDTLLLHTVSRNTVFRVSTF